MWRGVEDLETSYLDSTKLWLDRKAFPTMGGKMLAFECLRKAGRRCHYGSSLSRR